MEIVRLPYDEGLSYSILFLLEYFSIISYSILIITEYAVKSLQKIKCAIASLHALHTVSVRVNNESFKCEQLSNHQFDFAFAVPCFAS